MPPLVENAHAYLSARLVSYFRGLSNSGSRRINLLGFEWRSNLQHHLPRWSSCNMPERYW